MQAFTEKQRAQVLATALETYIHDHRRFHENCNQTEKKERAVLVEELENLTRFIHAPEPTAELTAEPVDNG